MRLPYKTFQGMRILILSLVILPLSLSGQNNLVKILELEGSEFFATSLIKRNNNSFLVTGSKKDSDNQISIFLSNLNAEGQILWTKNINISGEPITLKETTDGSLGMIYRIFESGDFIDYHFMKLSHEGEPEWAIKLRDYDPNQGLQSYPNLTTIDNDFILRYYFEYNADNYIMRINSEGVVVWAKCLKTEAFAHTGIGMLALADGIAFSQSINNSHSFLIKIDNNGNLMWSKYWLNSRLTTPLSTYNNNDILLQGFDVGQGENYLIRVTSLGELIWLKTLESPIGTFESSFSTVLSDESALLYFSVYPSHDQGVLRLKKNGVIEWVKMYYYSSLCYFDCITAFDNGNVFFLGIEQFLPQSLLIKTNESGTLDNCSYQDVCFSTVDDQLIFIDSFPEMIDTMFIFNKTIPTSFLDSLNLVDYCPECGFPNPYFETPDTICVNTCFRPTGMCNTPADGWLWTFEGATPATSNFPSVPDICYDQAGTYTITHVVNIESCPDSFSRQIVVIDPQFYPLSQDRVICEAAPQLFDASHPLFSTYLWEDSSTAAQRNILTSGLYALTIGDGYCEQTLSIQIDFIDDLYPENPINLGVDTTICEQIDYTLSAFHPNAETYRWEDGSTEAERLISDAGAYQVEVILEACPFQDSILITVQDCSAQIAFPNAFTPDGDGINDVFYPLGAFFEVSRIRIYNRWGTLIYDRENDNEGWDGTVKGKLAPSEVYLYQVEYRESLTGIMKSVSGDFVLLR